MRLMRQLDEEHRKLWSNWGPPSDQNIANNDCNPELLAGWTDPDLSLWSVEEGQKTTLQDILVALCIRKKDGWSKICYLIFDQEMIDTAGLSLVKSNGKTGLSKVDTSGTHYELKGVTGKGICTLLSHLSRDASRFKVDTFSKRQLDEILITSYDNRTIQASPSTATSIALLPQSFSATSPSPEHTPPAPIVEKRSELGVAASAATTTPLELTKNWPEEGA